MTAYGKTVLQNGEYVPVVKKTVTVWPKPDKNGDGPEVMVDKYDSAGNFAGRDLLRDPEGNPVHEYNPPEGFTLLRTRDPGSDQADGAYVRTDPRGMPVRNPLTGEAVGITPGSALVEHPDGTHELLSDDFSQVLFARGHTATSPAPESGEATSTGYRT